MHTTLLLIASLAFASPDTVTTGQHYRVFDAQGNPSSFEAIVEALASADVLFVGEEHNDPMVHFLERKLLATAFGAYRDRGVVLSMEMFSRDVQPIVNEYLADLITESHFRSSSNPWSNYATDYEGMVRFAKAHSVPVVASNAPRRYTNRVTRLGPDALYDLSDDAMRFLAPLPYASASDAYRAEWDALMAEAMADMQAAADSAAADAETGTEAVPEDAPPTHPSTDDFGVELPEGHPALDEAEATGMMMPGGPNHGGMDFMLDSQSLWDATMAWSVAEALKQHPGSLVIHVVGAFHVEHGTGIPEHLNRYFPGVRRVIVSVRPAEDIEGFDPGTHAGLGDFVVLTDEALPRTFTSR